MRKKLGGERGYLALEDLRIKSKFPRSNMSIHEVGRSGERKNPRGRRKKRSEVRAERLGPGLWQGDQRQSPWRRAWRSRSWRRARRQGDWRRAFILTPPQPSCSSVLPLLSPPTRVFSLPTSPYLMNQHIGPWKP